MMLKRRSRWKANVLGFPRKTFPDDFQDGIEKDTTQEVIDTSLKTKLKEGHDGPEGVEKIAEPSRVGVALSPPEVP
jgi:hypothetical protein